MSTVLDLAVAISLSDMVSSGVQSIIRQFRLLEGATEDVQRRMDRFRNMAFAGGAFAAGGALAFAGIAKAADEAVSRAGDLQEIMTDIRAQTFGKDLFDPTKAEEINQKMREMENLSTRLGLETTFSNLDAGRVILELQKGGIAYKDVVDGAAEATIKFAQLNKMAPDAAAELMVQTRAGFQLTGQQMLQAADIVTKVAAASSANAEDINRGLGNMAGVGAQMWGLRDKQAQVFDASALVALTRTQTPEGSSAGTFVRNFMERLVPQTKAQTKAMDEAGWLDKAGKSVFLDYSKDPRGQLKSALDIAKILRETVGGGKILADEKDIEKQFELAKQGMGTDKMIKLFHKVFGEQGGRTAYTLLRTGEGSLEEIQQNYEKQLTLQDRVNIQMQNYNQVVDTAKEAWNTFLTAIGSPLLESATKFFATINELLGKATKYFQDHPNVSKYFFAIAGGLSAFAAIAGTITVVIAAFGAIATALSAVGVGLGTIALISSGVVLAIGAIAGAVYLIYKHWDDIQPYAEAVWNGVKEAISPVVDWISTNVTEVFKAVSDEFVEQFGKIEKWISSNKSKIEQFFGFSRKTERVGNDPEGKETLKWSLPSGMSQTVSVVKGAWSEVWSYTKEMFGYINQFIKFVWKQIGPDITKAVKEVWQSISQAWKAVSDWTRKVWPDVSKIISRIWEELQLKIKIVSVIIGGIVIGAWLIIKNSAMAVWPIIKNVIVYFWDLISGIISTGLKILNGDWSGAWEEWKKTAENLKTDIIAIVKSLAEGIKKFFGGLAADALTWGANLIESFTDGIKGKLSIIPETMKETAQTIKDFLGIASPTKEGPLRTNHLWGGNLMKSIADGMKRNLGLVKSAAQETAAAMTVTGTHKTTIEQDYKEGRRVRQSGSFAESDVAGLLLSAKSGPLIGELNIHQQPGEDAEALSKRVAQDVYKELVKMAKKANLTLGRVNPGAM